MQNFVFHAPTKVIFGRGEIASIGMEIQAVCQRVLLVSGRGSAKKSGVYDQVCSSLREVGVSWVEFSGIKPNPTVTQAREGIDLARREQVQGVLGVGGGSVVDAAKAIAVGVAGDRDIWAFCSGVTVEACLPVFAVMTLAATGTEMNGNAVLTNEETQQKWAIKSQLTRPRVSVLDPSVTFTVPETHTAYGGVDAIAHVLEGYFNAGDPHTPLQDRMVEAIVDTAKTATEACLRRPDDYNARADLMWAAALALNGLTLSGTDNQGFPCHMIEHSLSALYDVTHGAGLAVVIPAWASWAATANPQKFARLGRLIFNVQEDSDSAAAEAMVTRFRAWCEKIGCPVTLAQLGIPETDIPAIAANAAGTAQAWGLKGYSAATITEILQRCQ